MKIRPTLLLGWRRRQDGITLIIALFWLMMMSLIAVAMYRSTDLATQSAGNLALATDNANRGDMCVRRVVSWINSTMQGNSKTLNPFRPVEIDYRINMYFNYRAKRFGPSDWDANYGLPSKLLSTKGNANKWMGWAADIDAGDGTVVNCTVERLCTENRAPDASHCQMVDTQMRQGSDGAMDPLLPFMPIYRISVRVDGKRGTSFSQVTFSFR
jgi:hypothetical protein